MAGAAFSWFLRPLLENGLPLFCKMGIFWDNKIVSVRRHCLDYRQQQLTAMKIIVAAKKGHFAFYLRFWHSSNTGLLSRGLPSGPILAGLWPKTTETDKAKATLTNIRILLFKNICKWEWTFIMKKKRNKKYRKSTFYNSLSPIWNR